jgi:hypothetical protein
MFLPMKENSNCWMQKQAPTALMLLIVCSLYRIRFSGDDDAKVAAHHQVPVGAIANPSAVE